MIDRQKLIDYAADYGIDVSRETAERLDEFAALLAEWNQKINLTAITDPEGMLIKHLLDSLTLLPRLPKGPCSLIDVGTGAGFPGIPLALMRPDIQVTLLDSLQKKTRYLQDVCDRLSIPAQILTMRAEQAGTDPALRERFDVATARAVAAMPVLCEYCLPLVKVGGRFLAMKGPDGEAEAAQAAGAVARLGGAPVCCDTLQLPGRAYPEPSVRKILLVEKKQTTPARYPRPSAKIAKQPLI
ncbi:MAG: 16S rRNA (guanine(527)-N(7))-methyltransferase RsmG [Clostridia bacterium]|nr:16S rRNA (guanine(527)-N(7))-methyltransferase RsmG [Clostridia bacterium]